MTTKYYHFESPILGLITSTKEELKTLQDVIICAQLYYYQQRDEENKKGHSSLADIYDEKAMDMCRTYNHISNLIGD